MVEKEQDDSTNGRKSAEVILVEALFNTPREKLSEMTSIPLDQVRPLSMMNTYIEEIIMLCDDMKEAQKQYSKYWAEYHPADKLPDVEQDIEYKYDKESLKLLVKEWLYFYYQLRRSVGGDHKRDAVVLSQDQIAAKTTDGLSPEDLVDRMHNQ